MGVVVERVHGVRVQDAKVLDAHLDEALLKVGRVAKVERILIRGELLVPAKVTLRCVEVR